MKVLVKRKNNEIKVLKISLQGLRSTKIDEHTSREETGCIEQSQEALDRTLTEVQEEIESWSTMDLGGHTTHRSNRIKELSESLTRKFKDLEKE